MKIEIPDELSDRFILLLDFALQMAEHTEIYWIEDDEKCAEVVKTIIDDYYKSQLKKMESEIDNVDNLF